jgi:hypothetical protein
LPCSGPWDALRERQRPEHLALVPAPLRLILPPLQPLRLGLLLEQALKPA